MKKAELETVLFATQKRLDEALKQNQRWGDQNVVLVNELDTLRNQLKAAQERLEEAQKALDAEKADKEKFKALWKELHEERWARIREKTLANCNAMMAKNKRTSLFGRAAH